MSTTPIAEDPRAIAAAEKYAEGRCAEMDPLTREECATDFVSGWQARSAAGPATREQGSAKCKCGGEIFSWCPSTEFCWSCWQARNYPTKQPPREQPAMPEGEAAFDHPCKQTCSGWKQGFERGQQRGEMNAQCYQDTCESQVAEIAILQHQNAALLAAQAQG